jgi:hypothetical protein
MHRSIFRRVLPLALVLFAVALPVTAQPDREPGAANLSRLASALWERLGASLVLLWERAPSRLAASALTPPIENTTDDGDGRIHIDPDG